MNTKRKLALQTHLADEFERAHREGPGRSRRGRIAVVGLVALAAYLGLVVESVKSTPEVPGLLVRR